MKQDSSPDHRSDQTTADHTHRTHPRPTDTTIVDREVVPVAEETLQLRKRSTETGRVVIRTSTEETTEQIEIDLTSTSVDIEHVPVGTVVDGPLPIRTEEDLTIIPVVEERIVTRTEWVLVEEVHVRKTQSTRTHTDDVTLRKRTVDVERTGSDAKARTATP